MAIPQPSIGGALDTVRAQVRRIEGAGKPGASVLPFGLAGLDDQLPGGGLVLGALHEVAGGGPGTEHGAAAALFVAGIMARLPGFVLWCVGYQDLFAPALALAGLSADRVVYVEAGKATLATMEDGLRHPGLAGVVGETDGRITLTASRRLHLAAETSRVAGFLLRRSRTFDDPRFGEPNAAITRWRIAALPSGPPLPHAPAVPGLARAVWRLDLVRCRGGEPASWIVEACDATGHLGLVSDLYHRSAAADREVAAAGRADRRLRA